MKTETINYKVRYSDNGTRHCIHLNNCNNILDAIYRFYNLKSVKNEIIGIEKW